MNLDEYITKLQALKQLHGGGIEVQKWICGYIQIAPSPEVVIIGKMKENSKRVTIIPKDKAELSWDGREVIKL